jgi:biotin transporter BioY
MVAKNLTLIEAIIPRVENKILVLVKDIALILSFAALTGIGAKLKIEIGIVPITGQSFAVLLSGALLGSIRRAMGQLTYLVYGLVGLPWFSRGGGMAYILSPILIGDLLKILLAGLLLPFGWKIIQGRSSH